MAGSAERAAAVRLLLDEQLDPAIAVELRKRGHDVQAVGGNPGREGLSDPDVLTLATAEHRAVVTNNIRDFRVLHFQAVQPGGPGHYGIVFMAGNYRRTKQDTGRIVRDLEAKLAEFPGEDDLAGQETWL